MILKISTNYKIIQYNLLILNDYLQLIRQEIRNGENAEELIDQLRVELHLPVLDPHLGHYELCFCPGITSKRGANFTLF
jgi:hypothetical protein